MAFLRLDSVSKRFFIREPRFAHRAARTIAASWLYERKKEIWALRDVSFEVGPGRMLGVIGRNGSGKSTLLKLIAGVSGATSGRIEREGSLAALLELGAGFHPDLTGYQNVYLQGNLMGLRKAEIDRRLGAIVEFSGLEEFMEWPVKRYSSGMYARLGFSVALHVGARIILIDEILAVGDAEFQRRGLKRIQEIRATGDSILILVTHDPQMAQEYCDELLWLEDGRIRRRGAPREVCEAYLRETLPGQRALYGLVTDLEAFERARAVLAPDSPLRILDASFRGEDGRPVARIEPKRPFSLVVRLEASRPVEDFDLTVLLTRNDERILAEIQSAELGPRLDAPAGRGELAVHFDPPILLEGSYAATVLIAENAERKRYLAAGWRLAALEVRRPFPVPYPHVIDPPHRWIVETAR
ncbi:MAG: ABC transporter ATP-binding protein [Candidatus Sumerlaeota bacterium]|nr:ABC transporter ATP-binding protein [Candidatus Sumerlaeota bacterium]